MGVSTLILTKKKMLTLIFTCILIISPVTLISPTSGDTTIDVAVVFGLGGLGDLSFNDAAMAGLQRAADKYGSDFSFVFTEPEDPGEVNTALEDYASEGYDLIIAIGFSTVWGVYESAMNHPSQDFLLIDAYVDLPNVASVAFREHEGSFLAGALAAMVTETNTIGVLAALDIPLLNKFRSGFEQGARYIMPSINIIAEYSPDPSNPFGDPYGGYIVANNILNQGADIIYAAAGFTGIGVFFAIAEADSSGDRVYAIGVDSNQDYFFPGLILTSMLKRLDVAVETQIDAKFDDSWVPGYIELGLAENGVGITDMEYTQEEANNLCLSGFTRLETVAKLASNIIDGSITVVPEIQSPEDYNTIPHPCGVETTNLLRGEIIDLHQNGILNNGQSNSLLVKLDHIESRIYSNRLKQACNMLNAFIAQVNDYVNTGVLTADQADRILSYALPLYSQCT